MKHILIVDDNKVNLVTAKSALDDKYKIITVISGAHALKYLEKNTCDLILLDINMPEMDGFAVLERIHQNPEWANIPVIFLTSDNDAETERRCLNAGAMDFIAKPFVDTVMRARIERIMELEDLRENLEEKIEERTARIKHIQQMMVLGMATLVESRDNSTGGHIKRTGDVVSVFANYLYETGYLSDSEFVKNIIRAAPMHDLGKIAVDDRILRKNGKFDDAEYLEMQKHSSEGAKVVEKLLSGVEDDNFVDIAVHIARHHHERWDGTGYPDGLSGEEIPLEARIMAFADVFDALASQRCYKPPFPYGKVFSAIEESLGTQFDPGLGKLFLACKEQLISLYDGYVQK